MKNGILAVPAVSVIVCMAACQGNAGAEALVTTPTQVAEPTAALTPKLEYVKYNTS